MKHQLKHRYTDTVLFECDVPDDVQARGMVTRYALEKAVKDGSDLSYSNLRGSDLSCSNLRGANLTGTYLTCAYLRDADLGGADLRDANLRGADLRGADLGGADLTDAYLACANLTGTYLTCAHLRGADLTGADLRDANLGGADLSGSDLRGANLTGANLAGTGLRDANLRDGEKLIGGRPVFMTGPIGSRCNYLIAYITDKGVRLRAGCFFGDVETFRSKLEAEHGDNDYAAEYRAALALIEKHAEIWTPKEAA